MQLTSFAPVVSDGPTVLVLGSMPGAESLRREQYYAHPRNDFWAIMGALCGFDPDLPYAGRTQRLQEAGVALWDVFKHCERPGSLDSDIVAGSETTHDIPALLAREKTIVCVGCNGRKAESTFRRHIVPRLTDAVRRRVRVVYLPSTSPANARFSRAEKQAAWQAIAPYLRAGRSP